MSTDANPAGIPELRSRDFATGGAGRSRGGLGAGLFKAGFISGWACAVLFAAGCAQMPTAEATRPAPVVAHLVIINESPSSWQVSAHAEEGRTLGAWRLLPASTVEAVVPAGSIVIRQTLLTDGPASGESRSFPMQLSAGETYRWRLVTLLTRPEESASPVSPATTP